jgi:hypothetical protein
MINLRQIPVLIVAVLLVACGQKQTETSVDEGADTKTSASSQGQPAEVQLLMSQAAESLKKKDEVAAVASLQSLRATPNLSVDQYMAVQDMMAKAQVKLAERAAAGDPQAKAALEMMKYSHR